MFLPCRFRGEEKIRGWWIVEEKKQILGIEEAEFQVYAR